ncbi:hypothetical protein [Salinibacter grassmerensis]|uniref:hypothetical protein n=1 Tax=Salinibacter grassmerensis TaxID=3040353 RepID=UPI0021E97381|nr:hypothetical protein [Salinibacter grassmerensis]
MADEEQSEEAQQQETEETSETLELTQEELENRVESKAEELADEKFQSKFDQHADDMILRGKKQSLRELGVDLDLVSEEDLREGSVDQIFEEHQEVVDDLKEDKIAELKEQVEENVREEYRPVEEKYEKLKEQRDRDLILEHADAYFDEEVIEGNFRQDFIEDVKRRTEFKEDEDGNFRRIAVDKDGDPVPSNKSDKAVKEIDEVVRELSDGKWNRFAIDKPQKTDSGYNENTTTQKGLTKQDVDRTDYIAENGYDAWATLPQS